VRWDTFTETITTGDCLKRECRVCRCSKLPQRYWSKSWWWMSHSVPLSWNLSVSPYPIQQHSSGWELNQGTHNKGTIYIEGMSSCCAVSRNMDGEPVKSGKLNANLITSWNRTFYIVAEMSNYTTSYSTVTAITSLEPFPNIRISRELSAAQRRNPESFHRVFVKISE